MATEREGGRAGQAPETVGQSDVRPQVAAGGRSELPLWIFVVAAILAGAILFVILDSNRRQMNAPAVKAPQIDLSGGAPPPTLLIPPAPPPMIEPGPVQIAAQPPAQTAPPSLPPPPAPVIIQAPAPPVSAPAPAPPVRRDGSPVLVIDNGSAVRAPAAQAAAPDGQGEARSGGGGGSTAGIVTSSATDTTRARAGAFANRATTITQGSLIPAVLESALDSTRPGFARAIVSRDVRGFDGSRVLIPRGSRLIGEYGSDANPGQKRALITWTRLIRPDGATIAIGSPVADTLGRTGLRAKVNTHFWERFSGAILQSALDLGVNLAAREANSSTVIALPGSVNSVTSQIVQPQQITPTLTVKRGTSISVFVARDLDFTGVEARR